MMPEAPALERRPRLVSFGPFSFDAPNRLLSRDGTEIPLPPRVLGVLELLLSRPGEVISRQELLDSVWKDAFVTDTSLAEAISFLRQALGDDPQAPRFVQTVHRRGYRFVQPVTSPSAAPPGVTAAPSAAEPLRPSIARDLAPWSITAACTLIALTALWQTVRRPAPDQPPVVRFQIAPAPGTTFDRRAPALAVSRDGRTMAWSACEQSPKKCELYVRSLDRVDAVRLKGTEGAMSPFFSPDGRWLGFFADGRLKKIAVSGGSAVTLADAPSPAGGSWGSDGRIVFAGTPAGGLSVTSDQGGGVEVLTKPRPDRGEVRHTWPTAMGDGRSVLFTIATSPLPDAPGQLALLPSTGESWRSLRTGVTRGAATGLGFLLFSTGSDLQAQAFDERAAALTGATDTVADGVATADGVSQFAVAGGSALATVPAAPSARRHMWADDPSHALTALDGLTAITISPDGRRAAGVSTDAAGSEVWIVDLERDTSRRVTFGGTNVLPVWTSDGRGLLFATRSTGPFAVSSFSEATEGRVEPVLAADGHVFPGSASARSVAVTRYLADGRLAIGIAPRSGGSVKLFDQGPFDRSSPALSPDGEWLAFASDESGRWEIYVQRVAEGRPVAVSNGGGSRPVWNADGRSIFYNDATRVMRAAFDRDREPHTAAPEVVFERADAAVAAVSPSGRVLIESQPAAPDAALVVLQWLRETRLRLPAPVTAPR